MSYTYSKKYKDLKEKLQEEIKYFRDLSDAFPDSELIRKKAESMYKIHEEILEMADDEIMDKEDEISDLEDDNRDLDDKVTDLEVELDEAKDKISAKGDTLEDHYKNELFEQLAQKYSLVKLSEILKPFL